MTLNFVFFPLNNSCLGENKETKVFQQIRDISKKLANMRRTISQNSGNDFSFIITQEDFGLEPVYGRRSTQLNYKALIIFRKTIAKN